MCLPELIGKRVIEQLNANGDERIDHDEFIGFFCKLLMGTKQQKMLIAFRMYDFDKDDFVQKEEVEMILKHIPSVMGQRYGMSLSSEDGQ